MARVTSTSPSYPSLSKTQLEHPVHFVIDMVNGFVKSGALHDEAIASIIAPIQTLIERLACRTIFVADSHPPQTREFLAYPPHCIIGSGEDEIVAELAPYIHQKMRKNSTNTFFCPDFQRFLEEELSGYREIVLSGCCTDICILQFALTLNAWLNEHNREERIIVVENCVETYHIDNVHDAWAMNAMALEMMKGNGIEIVHSIEDENDENL